jgi:ABC-2 type transport system permease protein
MKTLAIITNTFQEAFRKFLFVSFAGLSTLVMLFLLFALSLDVVEGGLAAITLFGQDVQSGSGGPRVEEFVVAIEGAIAVGIYTGGIFLSLFATAGLLPAMLKRGYAELLLSKPLHRTHLLAAKYAGGLSIVLFQIVYLVGGTWLILSIKTGYWNWGYLVSAGTIVVVFMNLFAIMFTFTLLMGNGLASLMVTYFLWLVLSPILAVREQIYPLIKGAVFRRVMDFLYHVLPKNQEIFTTTLQVVRGREVGDWYPFWSSILMAGAFLAIAAVLFSRKDF